MAQTYADNFNRSNASSLGTASGGWTWNEGATKFSIINTSQGSGSLATAQTPALDTQTHYGEVTYVSVASGGIANMYICWTDVNNNFRFFYTPIFPLSRMTANVSGVNTTYASDFNAFSGGEVIKFNGSGTVGTSYDLTVTKNGSAFLSANAVTENVGSGKKVGLEEQAGTAWVIDDFTAADVGGVVFIASKPVIIKQAVNRASTY